MILYIIIAAVFTAIIYRGMVIDHNLLNESWVVISTAVVISLVVGFAWPLFLCVIIFNTIRET
jgi:hypothetical protein